MDAAAELLFGQGREPALDHVEPGCAGGREVQLEARVARKPAMDGGGFVGGVVVDDEVDVEILGNGLVDGGEELAELDGAMPVMALAEYLTGFGIECGEQGRGAVVPWRT